uniref:Uncharacterized protein n=1 Tax=Anopheles epiroticus TaxID=199890 RepID=A0A9I3FGI0_9DIPT
RLARPHCLQLLADRSPTGRRHRLPRKCLLQRDPQLAALQPERVRRDLPTKTLPHC